MKRHHWLLLCGLVALGLLLFGALLMISALPAIAPNKTPPTDLEDASLRVAKSLYCPVCPGVPLDVCETQACQQWRDLIKQKLAAGQTPDQIQQYFVAAYGERVLGAPRPEGFNLVVYLTPLLAILAGLVLLYFAARRWLTGRALARRAGVEAAPAVPGEYVERIERELKETE